MTLPTMRDIINATATRLHSEGVGFWPGLDGEYPPTPPLPPVFAKRTPPTPPTTITINTYSLTLTPNPDLPQFSVNIQVRTRAPMDADPLGDKIVTALHGAHHQEWGGLHVDRCTHVSTGQLGADAAGLDERADNFHLIITPTSERNTNA